jgi:hypothetical protein
MLIHYVILLKENSSTRFLSTTANYFIYSLHKSCIHATIIPIIINVITRDTHCTTI